MSGGEHGGGWFRVPQWCMAMHTEEAAVRARAWVYLLGAWHAGDDPSVREVRRVTGFGGGRADRLLREVAAWAVTAGARVPARLVEPPPGGVAGQERGRSGAEAGRPGPDSTPRITEERGRSGAEAGQERGASRARDPLVERDQDGDRDQDMPGVATPAPGRTDPTPTEIQPPPGEARVLTTAPGERGSMEPKRAPAPPPDPLPDLWAALTAWTPKPAAWKLTPQRAKHLRARLGEHGQDAILAVATWVRESPHDRAGFLRQRGDVDTLLRPEKFATYLAFAATPTTTAAIVRDPATPGPRNRQERTTVFHHDLGNWIQPPDPPRRIIVPGET